MKLRHSCTCSCVLLLVSLCADAQEQRVTRAAAAPEGERGPSLVDYGGGPARTVAELYDAFDVKRAARFLAHADRFYRAEGSDGYEAVRTHLLAQLAAAGFGARAGLELEEYVVEEAFDCWTPKSARVTLEEPGGPKTVLHSFEDQADVERLMLPLGAPACDLSGPVALNLSEIVEGSIFVTDAPARSDILRRAKGRGAVAVLSSSLASYNTDPESGELLQDALRFRVYPRGETLPVLQISHRSHDRIGEAIEKGGAKLHVQAEVDHEERPLLMVAATIVGASRPEEAVVISSHIEYAGASDNASGYAASLEGALDLAAAIEAGDLPRPARSVVFLWGPQIKEAECWLSNTARKPVAALTLSAAGDAAAYGGSPLLLERPPDPGAIRTLAPDAHTIWGAGDVEEERLHPSGIVTIARGAMACLAGYLGGWRISENPWEGGSDHDVFLERGVPAVLFWHFTPSWYHTSLDRLERIDPEEMRRSAVATIGTALAIADPRPEDYAYYARALSGEEHLRTSIAEAAGDRELAQLWHDWSAGARAWLADLCRLK